jgi:aminoglycoside phosphotransferase (APT) family kinase protein
MLPILRDVLRADEYDCARAWWDELLADRAMLTFEPAVRHGDPWFGNLLTDAAGTLTGVVDWHGVAVADPAWDFAAQQYLGAGFFEHVLEHYASARGDDPALRYRAARLAELREFGGIRLAVAVDDDAELADAVRKLRAGPILRGAG